MKSMALTFLLLAALASCAAPQPYPAATTHAGEWQDAGSAVIVDDLGHWPSDPVTIEEATVHGDTLFIAVSHAGGCVPDHDFALVFSNLFMESLPVQMSGVLSRDGKGDMCRALVGSNLRFDLTPLKDAYRRAYGETSATIVLNGNWPGSLRYAF
jgi:hypothetical protein